MEAAREGKRVSVIDLDIVNPYFRTADFASLFESHGIRIISPLYANTNLDIPALTGAVEACLRGPADETVIIDVGGDDAGAVALGRYAELIRQKEYSHLYVINSCRYLTATAGEAASLLRDIEAVSHLMATGIVNNSNLGPLTDEDTVTASLEFAAGVSRQTGLPLWGTTVRRELAEKLSIPGICPVDIYVTSVWDREDQ